MTIVSILVKILPVIFPCMCVICRVIHIYLIYIYNGGKNVYKDHWCL